MARKRKTKRKKRKRVFKRYTYDITKRDRLFEPSFNRVVLDDLRYYHPEGKYRTEITQSGRIAEKVVDNKKRGWHRKKLRYKNPMRLEICRRRKERREILFKTKKIGRGKGGPSKRRLTLRSFVRC